MLWDLVRHTLCRALLCQRGRAPFEGFPTALCGPGGDHGVSLQPEAPSLGEKVNSAAMHVHAEEVVGEFPADEGAVKSTSKGTIPKVPGAAASTVNASSLWNSLLRWILHSHCGDLKSFCYSALQGRIGGKNLHYPGPVWPIPVPFPKVFCRGEVQPASKQAAWYRAANMMILVLNWLHMGKPRCWPKGCDPFASLNDEQLAIVERLEHLSGEWLLFRDVTAVSMGRTAGKVESLEAMVHKLEAIAAALSPHTGSGKGSLRGAIPSGAREAMVEDIQLAKPIEADRLNFKGRPSFDPSPYLAEPARSLYEDPLKFATPPEEFFKEVPAVKARGTRKELLALLAALDRTHRLALFSPREVRMGHRAGLFAHMKNLSADRLIFDSRPANLLEPGLNEWTQSMGSLAPILGLHVPPGHIIVAAGEDLKDYYYYYLITPSRAKRNAIAMTLTRAEARRFKFAYQKADRATSRYVPALATMAMGDLNSVEFGQSAHVRLALLHGLVTVKDLLTLRGRIPRQFWSAGFVIDDFIFLEAIDAKASSSSYVSSQLADAMVKLYEQVGLVANPDKRFCAELHPQFWGISIDGIHGLVRAQLDRVLPISFVTAKVAQIGIASRNLLEIIAGAWTAILQSRKRCMLLLDLIFTEIHAHDYQEVFAIPPKLSAYCHTSSFVCI